MEQVILLVCDADFVSTRRWAKQFRDKTIEEMIERYEKSNKL